MKLHLDRIAFEQIIDEVARLHGIRRDVLEKDYYVTLLLLELSRQENQSYLYMTLNSGFSSSKSFSI